jgi:hypothetical protein
MPPIVARQRLGRNVTAVKNTHVFYAVRVVSKESRLSVLPRTSVTIQYSVIIS